MDKEVYEVRFANWKQLILQCQNRPVGMTQKDWLEQHEIPAPQFYYWMRKVRKEAIAEMADSDHTEAVPTAMTGDGLAAPVTFAELDLSKAQLYADPHRQHAAAAIIRLGELTVELFDDADDQLLAGILKAVSHAD